VTNALQRYDLHCKIITPLSRSSLHYQGQHYIIKINTHAINHQIRKPLYPVYNPRIYQTLKHTNPNI